MFFYGLHPETKRGADDDVSGDVGDAPADGFAPAYDMQTAVDVEHALIVAQKVTMCRQSITAADGGSRQAGSGEIWSR